MNISVFNKKLAEKITSATLYEKAGNTAEAVNTWLEISEMTLTASKESGLDIPFRNMLINKVEEIVQHIKDLKGPIPKPADLPSIPRESTKVEDLTDNFQHVSRSINEPAEFNESPEKTPPNEIKKVESSDLKGIPKGFTEIEPSKDFKIVAPHDPNIVQQRLEQADKMDSFFNTPTKESEGINKEDTMPEVHIELDEVNADGSLICFACGYDKNPPNAETCSGCGVKIK